VGDAAYLTKLDLNKGFYQVQMAEGDIPKPAFCSPGENLNAVWA